MFVVTNLSNNPLSLSDGKLIASGESRNLKTVGESERKFETRGWLSIFEEAKDEAKTEKTSGGK